MLVTSILKTTAQMLGRADLAKYIATGETFDKAYSEREAESLLAAYNLVENEISVDYLPVYAEVTMESVGVIMLEDVHPQNIAVLRVLDEYGRETPFTVRNGALFTQKGKVTIQFHVRPTPKSLSDECTFADAVTERLVVYGTACEYCLANGMYDEAVVWDKKYKDALAAACFERRSLRVPGRRWI